MTTELHDKIRALLDAGTPFLAYMLPGADCLEILDDPGAHIAPWPGTSGAMLPVADTTPRDTYRRHVAGLIADLRADGGKTVIARTIAGDMRRDLADVIAEYFPQFPDCLRFVFFLPGAGYWFGASPELLLVTDGTNLRTRALAGTRPRGTVGEWSAKNIREHRFVVDDIAARLAPTCAVSVGEPYTIPYGTVEHLATDFVCPAPQGTELDAIIDSLHPTPAVGGMPRADAMRRIAEVETEPRRYYGGTISIDSGSGRTVYVVLRCAHTDGKRWAVYTGSGITGDSDPDDEWAETEAKAQPLLRLLSR